MGRGKLNILEALFALVTGHPRAGKCVHRAILHPMHFESDEHVCWSYHQSHFCI